MTLGVLDYWYDGQQYRFLQQVVAAFSGFQYQPGVQNGVQQPLKAVYCSMALQDRMVSTIIQNNSENTLLPVPRIAISQIGLRGRREDLQAMNHIDTLQVTERAVLNGQYTGAKGNSYTVQRIMPRPFDMKIQVDIWTSNQNQKYQLLEQILVIMYPTFQIQNSVNALDWTAVTEMHMEDDMTFSTHNPSGSTDSDIEVTTLNFRLPIWLSAPAKVKTQKIIETIIANVSEGSYTNGIDSSDGLDQGNLMVRTITTPGDYHIQINGTSIQLLNDSGGDTLADGSLPSWAATIELYGLLTPGVSTINIVLPPNDITGPFVTGTIQLDPNNVNNLLWQMDISTLPGNTLPAINAVIDPLKTFPGHGLPTPSVNDRYLLINSFGPSEAWGNVFSAQANDIIQYTVNGWTVSFDAVANHGTLDHVLNNASGSQLRWTGGEWAMSVDGTYGPGFWQLSL